MFDSSEIPGINEGVMPFHKNFIEKRPEDVKAFVRVWNKTTLFIKSNPEEAFRIIAKIYNKTTKEVADLTEIDKDSGSSGKHHCIHFCCWF